MTDNEKAATYIGWKEGEKCQRRHNEFMDRCSCGAGVELDERHDAAAPDMADPRNYMKALESCDNWRLMKRALCWVERNQVVKYGPNAITALAALYDAEHK